MSDELEAFVSEGEVMETVETTAESQAETPAEPENSAETETAPQGEQTGEPPAPESEDHKETMIPLAAKQAEKEKRKQAEERARQAELELARLQGAAQANQQAQQPKQEAPDPYTDPEAYTKYMLKVQNSAQLSQKVGASEETARLEYDDYDQFADYFADVVAKANPQMVNTMLNSPDPAKFAYLAGKKAKAEADRDSLISEAGGLNAYIDQQVQKKLAEAAPQTPKSAVPPNLAQTGSRGGDPVGQEIADGTDGLRSLLDGR